MLITQTVMAILAALAGGAHLARPDVGVADLRALGGELRGRRVRPAGPPGAGAEPRAARAPAERDQPQHDHVPDRRRSPARRSAASSSRQLGVGWVYAVNAISFLVVIVALLMMRDVRSGPRGRGRGERVHGQPDFTLHAALEGLRFVFRSPLIRSTMLLDFFATFFSSATALLPIFAQDILRVGARGYGWLYAAPAAGAIVASAVMVPRGRPDRASRTGPDRRGRSRYGLATVAFGVSRNFWLSFVCLALTGATDTVSMVFRNLIRQLETPDHLRGRMTGVNMVFFMGGPQLGELEAGLVANWFGAGRVGRERRHRLRRGDDVDRGVDARASRMYRATEQPEVLPERHRSRRARGPAGMSPVELSDVAPSARIYTAAIVRAHFGVDPVRSLLVLRRPLAWRGSVAGPDSPALVQLVGRHRFGRRQRRRSQRAPVPDLGRDDFTAHGRRRDPQNHVGAVHFGGSVPARDQLRRFRRPASARTPRPPAA